MKKKNKILTIAVDGFSSCGKSTFAKRIAEELDILYVDSGAMYRAVTLWAIKNGAVTDGEPDVGRIIEGLDNIQIEFRSSGEGKHANLYLNGIDSEKQIRSMEVSSLVSPVSKIPEVRHKLVELQRKMAENRPVVMDGRDIGSVVFPDADIKIYMTATPEIRAERRYKELQEKGQKADFTEVLKNINDRDHIDQNREVSPLRQAKDALILDNSHMVPDEQMEWFKETFKGLLS